MSDSYRTKIAAVQATPVFLDRDATVEKACELIATAGNEGADVAVFPEAFIPGYPLWVWFVPAAKTPVLRELYAELSANCLTLGDEHIAKLCDAARDAGVTVAMGAQELNTEASGATVYNSIIYISSAGQFLGTHRKLVPTVGERIVWGQGDGSDLQVHDTGKFRVGGLICWENYMPLARYAMYSQGVEVYVMPTWDRGAPWMATVQHVGKEGRCFAVTCCSAVHVDDVPDRLTFKKEFLVGMDGWINPGGAAIASPDGKVVAGPAPEGETILYHEFTRAEVAGGKYQLDVAGHYGRPDVFDLHVLSNPKPMVRFGDG